MGSNRLLYSLLFAFFWVAIPSFDAFAQSEEEQTLNTAKETFLFDTEMSKASNNFNWGKTYFDSYLRTREPRYLRLAATHDLLAIRGFKDAQDKVPRTTRFYLQADRKRLQACAFYDKIKRQSYLLISKHHITGTTGAFCPQDD